MSAHRFAWSCDNGDIPDGKVVCHSCDNPGCINPGHLFLGTQSDNMLDASKKKRWRTDIERERDMGIPTNIELRN